MNWPLNLDPVLREVLDDNLSQLPCRPDSLQIQRIFCFISLLHKWNQSYNLTAVRDPQQMLIKHIFDSLSIANFVRGPRILDVGTGAGLPGLPLAICLPQLRFVLLDAQMKRIRFIKQVCMELALENVETEQKRIETYRVEEKFATVITRAFAPPAQTLRLCLPFCAPDGQMLLMTGAKQDKPLEGLSGYTCMVHELKVPLLAAQRHVIEIKPLPGETGSWEK